MGDIGLHVLIVEGEELFAETNASNSDLNKMFIYLS